MSAGLDLATPVWQCILLVRLLRTLVGSHIWTLGAPTQNRRTRSFITHTCCSDKVPLNARCQVIPLEHAIGSINILLTLCVNTVCTICGDSSIKALTMLSQCLISFDFKIAYI